MQDQFPEVHCKHHPTEHRGWLYTSAGERGDSNSSPSFNRAGFVTIDHNLLSKPSSSLKHLSLFCSNYLELLLVGTLVFTVVKQSHPRAAGPQQAANLIMWNNLQTQGKTNIYRSKTSAGQLLPHT